MRFGFGNVDLEQYVSVSAVSRVVSPTRRLTRTSVPGRNGELVHVDGFEAEEITVTAHLRSHSVEGTAKTARALAAALESTEPRPLYLPDEPWDYVLAIYEGGSELSRNAHRPSVDLVFLVPDPVGYGMRRSKEVEGSGILTSGGSYRTWPTVTATPPAGSYWQVTNVGSGEFVRVEADFTGEQEVVVDMGLQRCTVSGYDHAVDVASDFFSIEGACEVRLSGGSARFEWEERWL